MRTATSGGRKCCLDGFRPLVCRVLAYPFSILFAGSRYSCSIHGLATLEEVEHSPETVACHTETPHMLRLMSKYMRENPQVWQTSTTFEGAARHDVEGFYADWITRPSST